MSLSKTIDVETFLVGTAVQAGLHPKREYLLSRAVALAADNQDPLRSLRNEFYYPKKGTLPDVDPKLIDPNEDSIYLCGNSLGLMPKATKEVTREQFEKWAHMGVFGHFTGPVPWTKSDDACTKSIAEIVGAHPSEVSLANGLTVNIHVLLTAFYKPTEKRHKILLESRAFPSDHYAIESQIRLHGGKVEDSMVCLEPRDGEDCLRMKDIEAYIEENGDEIAIIFFSGIQYYTGQLFDISRITAVGHKKGCLVGWDLAHAFANVPLALTAWDVDFACWCTYKYGCSGAGGIGGLYVNKRFANDKRDRMLGWWGHRLETRFAMNNQLDLDSGANGYRMSNTPAFLITGILGFLKVYKKTSMSELRNKSLCLTGYLEFLLEHHFNDETMANSPIRIEIMTPKDPTQRGCQLSLKFNIDIGEIYQKLVARGCALDKRYPHVIRVAPVHLYNSFLDVWRFVQILRECINDL